MRDKKEEAEFFSGLILVVIGHWVECGRSKEEFMAMISNGYDLALGEINQAQAEFNMVAAGFPPALPKGSKH